MEVNLVQINSQINVNKILLNTSSTAQSHVKFILGEMLKGQVQQIKENGLITININGELIDALSTVEVSIGQQLNLIVDSLNDGKAVLKIFTPEVLNKMENSSLSNNLKEMNFPADDKNVEMAKKLIQHNLPLTADNFKNISKGLNLLNGLTPKNLEVVGLAMAKGAPITSQTLESLVQFLEGESNLASLTNEMVTILNKMESDMTDLTGLPAAATTNMQPNSSNDALKLLNKLIETITLPANQNLESDLADEIGKAIKINLTNENDLVRGLGLVKNILEQKETPEISKNLKGVLINKLGEMEKELAGQKIPNVMSRTSQDINSNFYYLSFPIKMDGEYRLSELKITKDAGKKSLADMDNVKFVVSLDTSKLGLVIFHVEWNKDASLKIQGVVENEVALKYIDTNFNKLIKDLESHNYVVDYNGIKVSENVNEKMRLKLEEKAEVVGPFEIDVWV